MATTPFEYNGDCDGTFVTIYQLYNGCCYDCSIPREYYIEHVFCYNCGSREYKDIIDYSEYMDDDAEHTLFCFGTCMYMYETKKRNRKYKTSGIKSVEGYFNEWYMQPYICRR